MTTLLLRATAGAVLTIALAACSHPAPPKRPPPIVSVITAQPVTVPLTHDFVGRLSAYRTADVRARVAGVLLKRTYQGGSEVQKGQLLFQIDPAPFQAALDNAKAQLVQAQATYANDRVDAVRARRLAPKGYISKSDLDNAEAAERTSKAAVQAAQANVRTATIHLGYTRVSSPITGRAGEQQVTEGALVGQSTDTLLTTVSELNPLYVNFTISIRELYELRHAENAGTIELSAPDKTAVNVALPDGTVDPRPATLDFSSPTVDPATGAVKLRAILPNPKFTFLPGTYVTLKVHMGQRHSAFLVPQAALQRDLKGPFVLTVNKNNQVEQLHVTTAGMHAKDWVVTAGLAAGDRIIVSGIQDAHVGAPARPVPWHTPVKATATARKPGGGSAATTPSAFAQ